MMIENQGTHTSNIVRKYNKSFPNNFLVRKATYWVHVNVEQVRSDYEYMYVKNGSPNQNNNTNGGKACDSNIKENRWRKFMCISLWKEEEGKGYTLFLTAV